MLDPRCWREVWVRAGMTLLLAAVLYIWLKAPIWVWLAPPLMAGLVILKWAVRPEEPPQDVADDSEDPGAQPSAK